MPEIAQVINSINYRNTSFQPYNSTNTNNNNIRNLSEDPTNNNANNNILNNQNGLTNFRPNIENFNQISNFSNELNSNFANGGKNMYQRGGSVKTGYEMSRRPVVAESASVSNNNGRKASGPINNNILHNNNQNQEFFENQHLLASSNNHLVNLYSNNSASNSSHLINRLSYSQHLLQQQQNITQNQQHQLSNSNSIENNLLTKKPSIDNSNNFNIQLRESQNCINLVNGNVMGSADELTLQNQMQRNLSHTNMGSQNNIVSGLEKINPISLHNNLSQIDEHSSSMCATQRTITGTEIGQEVAVSVGQQTSRQQKLNVNQVENQQQNSRQLLQEHSTQKRAADNNNNKDIIFDHWIESPKKKILNILHIINLICFPFS